MGYLIDPPNNRGRTLVEQLDELREFCNRLTVSLNETLNSLNTGNMDEATQKRISSTSAATLQALQTKTSQLEQRLNDLGTGTGGGGEGITGPITISDVDGLAAALEGKSPTGHTHAYSTLTGKPEAMKNPQPLTINGTAYDGSEAVELTISGGGGSAPITGDALTLLSEPDANLGGLTVTLSDAAANYRMLAVELDGTYAGIMWIPVGAAMFLYHTASTSNTGRLYTLAGNCTWGTDTVSFAYTMRTYSTTSGNGSSTADVHVKAVYGLK